LISSALTVEHYEIARYGTVVRWAERPGYNDAADLLDEILEEEKQTNELLTQIANENADLDDKCPDQEELLKHAPTI
jgi:ferritin-like metal-binding protein YciE